jgi:hypothetical protein
MPQVRGYRNSQGKARSGGVPVYTQYATAGVLLADIIQVKKGVNNGNNIRCFIKNGNHWSYCVYRTCRNMETVYQKSVLQTDNKTDNGSSE